MKICIDARSLRDTPTGLGRYAATLVSHIARLDRQNEYVIVRRPSLHGPIAEQANFREISLPYDISSARNILVGAKAINALKADIYHSLFHFLPIGIEAGQVLITLHDFIWVDHPALADNRRLHRWFKGSLGKVGIRRAIGAADYMITGSEATRRAAIDEHGVSADRITTIYHGVSPEWQLGFDQNEATLPDICRGRRFIFSLGNSLPYKNLPRLMQAFAELAPIEPDLLLVFAGRGASNSKLSQLAQDLHIEEQVHIVNQLTDAQVHACFTNALFFAFPSLVEGFGLPLLEAMASGCPVLTSNCSSLAEIAGEDAVLINPFDIDSIAGGMRQLLADPILRQRLAQQGQQRSATFTWETSALQTLQVYQQIAGLVSAHSEVD